MLEELLTLVLKKRRDMLKKQLAIMNHHSHQIHLFTHRVSIFAYLIPTIKASRASFQWFWQVSNF